MLKRFKGMHYRDPDNKINIITNEVKYKESGLSLSL